MVSSKAWALIGLTVVILSLLMSGCGGGGSEQPTGKAGAVSGQILDALSSTPLGGINVTIGGKSTVTDELGNFLLTGIVPGTRPVVVTANPDSGLVTRPGTSIVVTVLADRTVPLAKPVFMWLRDDLPVDPPV